MFKKFMIVVAVAVVCSIAELRSTPAAEPAKASLADLKFMIGTWESPGEKDPARETWGPAIGGAMVGAAHLGSGPSATFEMESIEERDDGVFMFIIHYRPGLIAREKEATKFKLTDASKGKAVFEEQKDENAAKLTYSADGKDMLNAKVETHRGGKPVSFDFKMKRSK